MYPIFKYNGRVYRFTILIFNYFFFLAKIPHLLVHLSFKNTSGLTILDESGSGNNAKMSGAIMIRPSKGKCGPVANFNGGKILFGMESFRVKPRLAITIALWVKLDHFTGSMSLFSVQRNPAGQGAKIDLRVSADRIWWAHVDENRKLIFDVSSSNSSQIVLRVVAEGLKEFLLWRLFSTLLKY